MRPMPKPCAGAAPPRAAPSPRRIHSSRACNSAGRNETRVGAHLRPAFRVVSFACAINVLISIIDPFTVDGYTEHVTLRGARDLVFSPARRGFFAALTMTDPG